MTGTEQTSAQELAAATAVVRRYYSLLANVNHVPPAEFARLMTAGCQCRTFVKQLRVTRMRHEHFLGSADHFAYRPSLDTATRAEVLVSYDATAGRIVNASGHTVSQTPRLRRAALNYFVDFSHMGWRIAHVDVVSEGRG